MARLPDELVERIKRDGPNCERSVRHDQSRALGGLMNLSACTRPSHFHSCRKHTFEEPGSHRTP